MLELGRRAFLLASAGSFLVPKRSSWAAVSDTGRSPAAVAGTGWTRKSDWRFGTGPDNNIRQFTDWLQAGWYIDPTAKFLNNECQTYNTSNLGNGNPNFQPFSDHCDIVALWNGGPIESAKANGSISSLMLNYNVPFANAVGYYELTCKIPSASGVWPAWWTVGYKPNSHRELTWGPEIDIFEFYDTKSDTCISTLHGGRTPSHCFLRAGGKPPGKPETPHTVYEGNQSWDMGHFNYAPGVDFAQAYHRFGAKIDPSYRITIWVDDVKIGTFAADQYCDDEGHPVAVNLTVNLALGTHNPDPVASIHAADFGGTNNRSSTNRFRYSLKNIQIWGL